MHINNSSKRNIKIRINRDKLSKIKKLAKEKQIFINDLIEPEIIKILKNKVNTIIITKKERVEFSTTSNVDLINQIKELAKINNMTISDIVEQSMLNYLINQESGGS